jgi:hypothetical protein
MPLERTGALIAACGLDRFASIGAMSVSSISFFIVPNHCSARVARLSRLQPGSALLADLSFKRQSVPGSCHVNQDGLHSRIWRTLRHLPSRGGGAEAPRPAGCATRACLSRERKLRL